MADPILYCGSCGKRIPPEEAEAEDFQALGGEPACGGCLEKADPGRKRRLAEVRSTRLRWRSARAAAVAQAQAPQQVYPPVGTPPSALPSDTAISAVRRELERDLEEVAPAEAVAALSSASQASRRPRHLVWWVLLLVGLLAVALLLALPDRDRDLGAESDAPPDPVVSQRDVPKSVRIPVPAEDVPITQTQVALAEVELIRTQVGDAPAPAAAEVAIGKLKAIALRAEEPVRSTALAVCQRYETRLDVLARQTARDAAQRAEDLGTQWLFEAAVEHLRVALRALPSASPWAQRAGRGKLESLIDRWSQERREQLSACSAKLESELAVGHGERVEALVAELKSHPEKEFQDLARAYANQLAALRDREELRRRENETLARAAWPQFFAAYDAALAARDFDGAARLCTPEADSPLRKGGLAQPEAVLAGFAEVVERIRQLHPLALQAAEKLKGERVQLRLTTGQIEGVLRGVSGTQLVLVAGNDVEVRLSPGKLSSEALAMLLAAVPRSDCGPGLAGLRFAEGPRDSEERRRALVSAYQELRLALPACWARRFELERRARWRETIEPKLEALRKALDGGQVPVVREALTQLRPSLAGGSLTKPEEELLAAAEKLAGSGRVALLVFQNSRLPTPEFQGLRIDQIGAYYKDIEKCDVDLDKGLRAGSINDLQRILIRFDGLDGLLGPGRLIKATLELYQIESPQAEGANVALYPLKRAWAPDGSSWVQADRLNKVAWEKPGASGREDAAWEPVAQVLLDKQKGLWRSWDVTEWVRGLLDEPAKHPGLLLRVVKDEPRFGVRFYPDAEVMVALKDPALRPRLVVEFEKFGPNVER